MAYAVETAEGSIVATNGEVYKREFIGPGTGHSARIWKTRKGAERFAQHIKGGVIELNERGEEVTR